MVARKRLIYWGNKKFCIQISRQNESFLLLQFEHLALFLLSKTKRWLVENINGGECNQTFAAVILPTTHLPTHLLRLSRGITPRDHESELNHRRPNTRKFSEA